MASTHRHAALLLNKQGPWRLEHPVHGMDGRLADASWFTFLGFVRPLDLKARVKS
jgi:hypothetical protein